MYNQFENSTILLAKLYRPDRYLVTQCRDPVCGKKHLTSAAVIFTWPFQIIDTHQPPPVFSAKIAFKNHMNFIQITSRIEHCTAIITLWLPHVLMAKQKKIHLLCVTNLIKFRYDSFCKIVAKYDNPSFVCMLRINYPKK